jgi:hypothetical protein
VPDLARTGAFLFLLGPVAWSREMIWGGRPIMRRPAFDLTLPVAARVLTRCGQ